MLNLSMTSNIILYGVLLKNVFSDIRLRCTQKAKVITCPMANRSRTLLSKLRRALSESISSTRTLNIPTQRQQFYFPWYPTPCLTALLWSQHLGSCPPVREDQIAFLSWRISSTTHVSSCFNVTKSFEAW